MQGRPPHLTTCNLTAVPPGAAHHRACQTVRYQQLHTSDATHWMHTPSPIFSSFFLCRFPNYLAYRTPVQSPTSVISVLTSKFRSRVRAQAERYPNPNPNPCAATSPRMNFPHLPACGKPWSTGGGAHVNRTCLTCLRCRSHPIKPYLFPGYLKPAIFCLLRALARTPTPASRPPSEHRTVACSRASMSITCSTPVHQTYLPYISYLPTYKATYYIVGRCLDMEAVPSAVLHIDIPSTHTHGRSSTHKYSACKMRVPIILPN